MLLKFLMTRGTVCLSLGELEDLACLPRTHSSGVVSHHMKTEHNQSKNKERWEENLPCGQVVLVDSRRQTWLSNKHNTGRKIILYI